MFVLNRMIVSLVAVCVLAASLTIAAPAHGRRDAYGLATRQSSDRLVFCHFMVSHSRNSPDGRDHD